MSIKVFENENPHSPSISLFKGGEVNVKVGRTDAPRLQIEAVIENSNDVMALLMVTDALRRTNPGVILDLVMPYVPYARQDRVMQPGESLSIKVFCDLINAQRYNSVTIWDPHSDVTPALLNQCNVVSQAEILRHQLPFGKGAKSGSPKHNYHLSWQVKEWTPNVVLVSPDAGANKKIGEAAKLLGFEHVVRADKKRDVKTLEILETVVYSDHIGDKDFLIVDDICDGGRTFIELAKVLRPLTNGKIILYVTHGIFSYGLEVFKGHIDEIYCAHSFGKYPPNTNLLSIQQA